MGRRGRRAAGAARRHGRRSAAPIIDDRRRPDRAGRAGAAAAGRRRRPRRRRRSRTARARCWSATARDGERATPAAQGFRAAAPATAPPHRPWRPPRPRPSTAPEPPAPVVPDTPAALLEPRGLVPLAKPPVRKLAKDLGIDLRTLTGTGAGGVITREDVEQAAAADRRAAAAAVHCGQPARGSGGCRSAGVRKATAAAMVGQRVHRAARHRVPDRRRHRRRWSCAPGCGRTREFADVEAHPAGVRRQGGVPGGPAHPGGQRALGRGGQRDRLLRLRAARASRRPRRAD